jgi:hypothetical protein
MSQMRGMKILYIMTFALFSLQATAQMDVQSTVKALRIANMITGGFMPTSDPLFTQMVTQVKNGQTYDAAWTAVTSPYFANYLARRFALQMQTPALDASSVTDGDGSVFLIAHFTGGPTWKPSISTIWSENQSYGVTVPVAGVPTVVHIQSLPTATVFSIGAEDIDYSKAIAVAGPQQAILQSSGGFMQTPTLANIPNQDIGGYVTASQGRGDASFAQYGAFLGTNLRMIEGIWEISTGLTLADFEDNLFATDQKDQAAAVPQFVPQDNPNFYVGQGQAACIACHGGGLSAIKHGYATVADVFEYGANVGFIYNDVAATDPTQRKSLGSNGRNRTATLACNLTKTPGIACNAGSAGVGTNKAWDLSSWQANGMLSRMGWRGPVTGQGLNQLGVAIGKASLVYENLTVRVINEICPVGSFTYADVSNIANQVDPFGSSPGTDDLRTIIALVASNPSCL